MLCYVTYETLSFFSYLNVTILILFYLSFQKQLLIRNNQKGSLIMNPLFRSESFGPESEHSHTMMEKRQLFLRSYRFCRKKSLKERVKGSLVRVKKVLWLRLRSAKKLRRLFFSRIRIKCGFYYRRRRFSRLLSAHNRKIDSSSCLW